MSKPSKKKRVPAGEKNPLRVLCDFVELVTIVSKGEHRDLAALEVLLDCNIGALKEHEQLERLGQFGLAMHRKAERKLREMSQTREPQIIPFPSRTPLRPRSR